MCLYLCWANVGKQTINLVSECPSIEDKIASFQVKRMLYDHWRCEILFSFFSIISCGWSLFRLSNFFTWFPGHELLLAFNLTVFFNALFYTFFFFFLKNRFTSLLSFTWAHPILWISTSPICQLLFSKSISPGTISPLNVRFNYSMPEGPISHLRLNM